MDICMQKMTRFALNILSDIKISVFKTCWTSRFKRQVEDGCCKYNL